MKYFNEIFFLNLKPKTTDVVDIRRLLLNQSAAYPAENTVMDIATYGMADKNPVLLNLKSKASGNWEILHDINEGHGMLFYRREIWVVTSTLCRIPSFHRSERS